jgi:hypothetical protein
MGEQEHEVVIPEAHYATVTAVTDGMPAVILVNASLCDFEPKVVFGWHLSIQFTLTDPTNGLPSPEEKELLIEYEDRLEPLLRGVEGPPNALFLGTCTWNGRREVMFRVYDPERANTFLKEECARNDTPRAFHYEMEHDPEWKRASTYLDPVRDHGGEPGAG